MRTVWPFEPAGLELLDDLDCLRLLRTVPVGRLVFTRGGLPAVRLLGFRVDEDTIVFGSDDEDEIRAALRGDVVAFEADDLASDRPAVWTVTTLGHLSAVSPEEAKVLAPAEPARQLIRLGIESVTGHRILV